MFSISVSLSLSLIFLLMVVVLVAGVVVYILNLCRQIINDPVIIQKPNLKCLPFHFKVVYREIKNGIKTTRSDSESGKNGIKKSGGCSTIIYHKSRGKSVSKKLRVWQRMLKRSSASCITYATIASTAAPLILSYSILSERVNEWMSVRQHSTILNLLTHISHSLL